MTPARKKVLIIDDSALVRSLLKEIIGSQPDLEVVGAAPDPIVARELVRTLSPDVITLDVEMPRMDGLEFLDRLMRLKPTPVVMVSSLTERGADATLRALELGAVDFVAKPKLGISEGLRAYSDEICEKIRNAAKAKVRRSVTAANDDAPRAPIGVKSTETVIAIGSSTGGTEALRVLLQRMPPDSPGIVVTQHMPPGFTKSFAERLDQQCKVSVHEAQGGERVLPGHVYIAPGDRHLVVKRSGANYVTAIVDSEPVNRHRPSVDVLFQSVAQCVGGNAIGVMLTGMGKDGAHHMRTMKEAGAWNIAQDEASCVVYGMPKEAIAAGGVDEVLPLTSIADRIVSRLGAQGQRHVRV